MIKEIPWWLMHPSFFFFSVSDNSERMWRGTRRESHELLLITLVKYYLLIIQKYIALVAPKAVPFTHHPRWQKTYTDASHTIMCIASTWESHKNADCEPVVL